MVMVVGGVAGSVVVGVVVCTGGEGVVLRLVGYVAWWGNDLEGVGEVYMNLICVDWRGEQGERDDRGERGDQGGRSDRVGRND